MHIFHKSFVKHLTILAIRNFGETEIFFFNSVFSFVSFESSGSDHLRKI